MGAETDLNPMPVEDGGALRHWTGFPCGRRVYLCMASERIFPVYVAPDYRAAKPPCVMAGEIGQAVPYKALRGSGHRNRRAYK
jgi:hypothetical protein